MLTQLLRTTTLASVALFGVSAAQADYPARFVGHSQLSCHEPSLPVFGMHSYNDGWGEQIVRVRHGGLACQLGIAEGDTILKLNHLRLRGHGSWEYALRDAMTQHGGHIELLVRDGYTRRVATRHIDLDPYGHVIESPVGPVTPKSLPVARRFNEPRYYNVGKPVVQPHIEPAPITPKTVIRRQLGMLLKD